MSNIAMLNAVEQNLIAASDLTDQDVDALVDAVVAALGREHRAEIRR